MKKPFGFFSERLFYEIENYRTDTESLSNENEDE